MAKKKKKEKVVEKIPFNLEAKIALGVFIGVVVLCVLATFLGALSPSISTFLWKTVGRVSSGIRYLPSQYLIIKIGPLRGGLHYLMIFVLLILLIVTSILEKNTKMLKRKRNALYLHLTALSFYIASLMILFTFSWTFINFNHPKLDTIFFPEEVDNTYTEQDLYLLHDYLEGKVIELAHEIHRDKAGYLYYKTEDIEKQAKVDLKNASNRYWMLKGAYPNRLYHFDDYDLSHNPSVFGLTTIDSVGVYYEQSPVLLMNTFTHELCHSKGVMRENEATLCSIMVGLESDDILSQYAAYFEAYSRSLDVLNNIDYDKYIESEGKVYNMCLKNQYKEICDASFKLTQLYVHDSDKIHLSTYFLTNYDYPQLKRVIEEFDEYSYQLEIGKKKITLEELESYMDQNVKLTITFKNSKKIFSKVQPLLEKYKDYFYSIFQEYPDMYVGIEKEKEDAIEYYTSSIPNSTFIDVFTKSDEIDEIFDYSRVVRLILEYFDAENIGYSS